MLKVLGLVTVLMGIMLVLGVWGPQTLTAQQEDWKTYTNDEFKFSIDYPAEDIQPKAYLETDDFLILNLMKDDYLIATTDEEYSGSSVFIQPKNMSSLSEHVDKDLESESTRGPITSFEGPMDISVDQSKKSCFAYTYSKWKYDTINRVILCEHDDKIYKVLFKGKSILFHYDEEPYNHMVGSIKFFD